MQTHHKSNRYIWRQFPSGKQTRWADITPYHTDNVSVKCPFVVSGLGYFWSHFRKAFGPLLHQSVSSQIPRWVWSTPPQSWRIREDLSVFCRGPFHFNVDYWILQLCVSKYFVSGLRKTLIYSLNTTNLINTVLLIVMSCVLDLSKLQQKQLQHFSLCLNLKYMNVSLNGIKLLGGKKSIFERYSLCLFSSQMTGRHVTH